MNDIYVLQSQSRNGFSMAVIAVAPGSSPYAQLAGWFEKNMYTNPWDQTKEFQIIDRLERAATIEGVIAISEWYDNDLLASGQNARRA